MKTVSGDRFVNQPAAVLNRPSIFPPMQYANVPVVDARYWAGISLASFSGGKLLRWQASPVASFSGGNMGDFVSLYLYGGLFPLTIQPRRP